MRYMGSKRKLWKYISPIILKDRKPNQFYIEPFCGGCNSLSQVNGKRIAADINIYLIEMWKSLIKEEKQIYPITKEIYNDVRNCYRCKNSRYSFSEIGWVGFMASYNGRFFDGGFSGNNVRGKNGGLRHYIDECMSDILQRKSTSFNVSNCCKISDIHSSI